MRRPASPWRNSAITASSIWWPGLRWQTDPKHYTNTSPPLVYKDLIIAGNGVGDRLAYKQDPPGDVRAFYARTGKLAWTFHTVPMAGEFGADTWERRFRQLSPATPTCGRP